MTDKFLFFEDVKGKNGKVAQENAIEELDNILKDEFECSICFRKDVEIETLEDEIDELEKSLEIERKAYNLLKVSRAAAVK